MWRLEAESYIDEYRLYNTIRIWIANMNSGENVG